LQIQTLQCSSVAPSSSPLVQGVIYGELIFLSGQLGKNPQTGKLESGFEAETSRVLENLKLLLEEAGSSMDKVLKVTVFLTDLSKMEIFNKIYRSFFPNRLPARSCVAVAALAGGATVEIELVAAL